MRKIYRNIFEWLQIAFLTWLNNENLNILSVQTKKIVTLHPEK